MILQARGGVHIAVCAVIEINDIVNVFENHLKSKLNAVFLTGALPAGRRLVFDFCL